MPQPPFESYAQNGEDVVLWRALGHVPEGRYVDVGANHPAVDSVTRAFYEHGWRGITVEPMPHLAALHREQRPGDLVVEAAVTADGPDHVTLHEIEGTGLSTLVDEVSARHGASGYEVHDITVVARRLDDILEQAGWDGLDIHFLIVDVEAAELEVMRSVTLSRWRPWVLVVEATLPQTTEPSFEAWEPLVTQAGYRFCLFDGLSRFYVSEEHAELAAALSYPAGPLDTFTTLPQREAEAERKALLEEVHRLNQLAHSHWVRLEAAETELARLRDEHHRTVVELDEVTHTLSWRLTRPLRTMRHHLPAREHDAGDTTAD